MVSGSIAGASAVAVNSGGTLGGTGTINGAVTEQSGGIIDAGTPAGTTGILKTGNLTLASGGNFTAVINSSTAGTGYDEVNVTGTVNLAGATLNLSARTAHIGDQIVLINNDGSDPITGTFAGLAQGSIVTLSGVFYTISYAGGDGNDVVLTDIGTSIITWANAAGHANWNDTAAWAGGIVPQATNTAVFASAATVVNPNLTAAASTAGIIIDNSQANYSITQTGTQTLTVGSGGIAVTAPSGTAADTTTISPNLALGANQTLTAANDTGVTTLTISGAISGGFNLTTAGSGNINFNGAIGTTPGL